MPKVNNFFHTYGISLGFLAVFASLSCSAIAGWQYAEWGMTMKQLKKAAKSAKSDLKVLKTYEKIRSDLLIGARLKYNATELEFNAVFVFSNSVKLERIVLRLAPDQDGSTLFTALTSVYGAPESLDTKKIKNGNSHKATWHDEKSNNIIHYFGIGSVYVVEYHPLEKEKAKNGL